MSKRVKWITYKGLQILFSNYSGLDERQSFEELQETIMLLTGAVDRNPPLTGLP